MTTLEKIRAEIKTKYDSIPWRDNDYNDGWVEALEWVYDDVLDKYAEPCRMTTLQRIRAEIESEYNKFRNRSEVWDERANGIGTALEIIDRYAEQEPTDEWQNGYMQGVENTAKEFKAELDQISCEDAVSRQAVQDTIEDWLMSDDFDKRDLVQRLHGRINELPSVQPKRNE